MERKINSKITGSFIEFKNLIIDRIKDINDNKLDQTSPYYKLIQDIYNYPIVKIEETDLKKRKRIKNIVPLCERCCALRASDLQCSRRRKDGYMYCGTHIKGRPHGEISDKPTIKNIKKTTIWLQEIQGIYYYIDDNNNVYDNYDISNNIENPKIIAKYKKNMDEYTIPELFQKQ